MGKKPPPPPAPAPSGPFNAALAKLGALRDTLLAGDPGDAQAAPSTTPPKPGRRPPARAVVRYERKGRGGKEATVVEQLDLSLVERGAWLLAMMQALGCGGVLEGDALVLQGDQRERVRAWLEKRGVGRISVG